MPVRTTVKPYQYAHQSERAEGKISALVLLR